MHVQDISKVTRVYSGEAYACMCGCKGKYNEDANSRGFKIIAGKLVNNPDTHWDEQAKCFYVNTDTRTYAAYTD